MNTKILGGLVVLVVIALAAFYAGTAYGKGRVPMRGSFTGGGMGGQFASMRGARGMGGFTAGEIISKDATSITLKLSDGSTKIILVGTSTPVMKSAAGTLSDLTVGISVVANGSANSDGSLSAQSIQIRPAGSTSFGMGRSAPPQ